MTTPYSGTTGTVPGSAAPVTGAPLAADPAPAAYAPPPVPQHRQLSPETKPSFKTTELLTYLAAVAGVLIASYIVGRDEADDFFRAERAWLYVTMLTIGYMISRGLAKSGSRDRYDSGR